MVEWDKQEAYRFAVDDLRIERDLKFRIVSKRVKTPEGYTWVRDATQALALDDPKRPSHDRFDIETNNVLLRCLTRLRPIDYVISKQESLDGKDDIREALYQKFEMLSVAIRDPNATKASIKEEEEKFNTFLIEALHEANLTKGCSTKDDAEALLAHYKVLYSVLDPAMPLVTLTYDKESRILQRETQYPVTEKTAYQKKQANILKEVRVHPLDEEKNSHTVHNEAKQQADACFADLLVDDDRMLTSQARKTHVMGVKNAFIVNVETEKFSSDAKEAERMRGVLAEKPLGWMNDADSLWLGRMAVPVYVGKGEKDADKRNEHVKANLEQLQIAAKKHMKHQGELNIHLTTLNTDTNIDGEKQDVMIAGLRTAMDGTDSEISVIPTNDVGMLYTPQLAPSMKQKGRVQPGKKADRLDLVAPSMKQKGRVQPGKKADRLDLAVDVVLEAEQQENTLSFVNCAGGADRTGTVIEAAIQKHTAKKMGVKKSDVEAMRARGFNSAEIAHHVVPGTPGMKPCSKANNWFGWGRKTFSDVVGCELYLKSADLNKKNKVKDVRCLKKPSAAAVDEYNMAVAKLVAATNITKEKGILLNLKQDGAAILARAKMMEGEVKPEDRAKWTLLYTRVAGVLNEVEKTKGINEACFKELQRLDKMCEVFSGQATVAKRIKTFIFSALVGAGALILLSTPFFHGILAVAGVFIALTSIKITSSLGLWGGTLTHLSSTFMGALNTQPDQGVVEQAHKFSKTGQTFFNQNKPKLQDSAPEDEDDLKKAPDSK